MRSGLYNYTTTLELNQTLDEQPTKAWTQDELLALAYKHQPDFTPGTAFGYSNTNTVLLGLIAEQLEGGKPLAAIMRDRLFAPLGLKNTLFPDIASNAIPEPYSRGYMYGNNVLTMGSPPALPDDMQAAARAGTLAPGDHTEANPSWGWAAGAGISTANDLVAWVQALVSGKLLNADLQARRLASVLPIDAEQSEQRVVRLGHSQVRQPLRPHRRIARLQLVHGPRPRERRDPGRVDQPRTDRRWTRSGDDDRQGVDRPALRACAVDRALRQTPSGSLGCNRVDSLWIEGEVFLDHEHFIVWFLVRPNGVLGTVHEGVVRRMPLERAVSLMACATKTLHFHVLARNVINDRVVGFLELDRIAAVSDDVPIEFHLDADAGRLRFDAMPWVLPVSGSAVGAYGFLLSHLSSFVKFMRLPEHAAASRPRATRHLSRSPR